jgi:hypothetical protein
MAKAISKRKHDGVGEKDATVAHLTDFRWVTTGSTIAHGPFFLHGVSARRFCAATVEILEK